MKLITEDGIEHDIPEETLELLKEIAARNGLTLPVALQQAVANEKFIEDKLDSGAKLLYESDGNFRELQLA